MTRVSTAIGNPTRTAAQGGAGWLLAETIEAFGLYDFTERQWPLVIILLGSAISAVQNLGENRGWWAAFLRQVPPTTTPVVDEVQP